MYNIKKIFLCLIFSTLGLFADKTNLLIKIPTRSRPNQFFKNLDKFYQKLSYTVSYRFLITCDTNDTAMNNPNVIKRLQNYPNLDFSFSDNLSKVEAFNKDIGKYDFDIVIALHDDMEPVVKNFDKIIVDTMEKSFPDYDGVLNFNDGFVGGCCNTLPVIGKQFYKNFGYIYNPEYKALVCNVELTLISKILKTEKVIDQVIIKHNHPAWNAGPKDSLYEINEKFHDHDREVFVKRRARNFELSDEQISKYNPKIWSILICTIDERKESLDKLCTKLKAQIKNLELSDQIEILCCRDKRGQNTIGLKRNTLLEQSCGKYISFIDDDDDIHDDYIKLIYEKLLNNPDCVSLTGIITTNSQDPKKFIHSIKYKNWFENKNTYFRSPNHLNAIKRAVAIQFAFPEKNFAEDAEWSNAIAKSELLKIEEVIDIPYYFYLFKNNNK